MNNQKNKNQEKPMKYELYYLIKMFQINNFFNYKYEFVQLFTAI